MTSELRPAVEVWQEAYWTWANDPSFGSTARSVSIIEADREAVRAEQAANIERLKSHLEDAKEIIQKQMKQAAELAKFKALAETLAGALATAASCLNQCAEGLATQNDMETWAEDATQTLRQYKEARDD